MDCGRPQPVTPLSSKPELETIHQPCRKKTKPNDLLHLLRGTHPSRTLLAGPTTHPAVAGPERKPSGSQGLMLKM